MPRRRSRPRAKRPGAATAVTASVVRRPCSAPAGISGSRDTDVRVPRDVRRALIVGSGISKAWVVEARAEGDPHAGFRPARSGYQERRGGVASSRREDPGYRSGGKTRRGGALAAGDGAGPDGGGGGRGGRGAARDALSLGEAAGAAVAPAAAGARAELDAGAGRGGRGAARRQPDVGQAQARADPAGARATPSPTPPSGASWRISCGSGARCRRRPSGGRPAPRRKGGGAGRGGCAARSRPPGPARPCRSTRCR